MNWDDARLFLAVARAGQMLGAAKGLGVNQATLSRRITVLESDLDTQLLERRTNGCTLTAAGAALAASLEQAESAILQGQAALQGRDSALSGAVRIGAPDGFGVGFLAPRLADLATRHPALVLQLVAVPRAFSLSQREADIAVMVGRPEQGRLVARKLTDYSVSLYAARAYLDQHGTPQTPADLARHRLVGYVEDLVFAPSLNYARELWRGWRPHIEISSAMGQVAAVRAGAGIGALHGYLARDLVPVLPQLRAERAYWVAYHESLKSTARVQAVVQFLIDAVRQHQAAFLA